MGLFATLADYDKCPKCGKRADWQSHGLWLTYKGREIWIGEEHNVVLDENMNGSITAYCWGRDIGHAGCGKQTHYKIIKGCLIETTDE